ncbi:hypothetical protein ACFE04_030017 [Oxalis oulophora]
MPQSNEINSQAELENNHGNLNTHRLPPHEMTLEEFPALTNHEAAGNSIIRSGSTPNPMPQSDGINSQAQLENNHVNLNIHRSPPHEMTLEELLVLANCVATGNFITRYGSTPNPMPLSNGINSQAQLENSHVNLNTSRPPQREMTLEEYLAQVNREEADNSIISSGSTPNPMPQSNEINTQAQLENNHVNLNSPRPSQHEMTLEEYLA